MDAFWLFHAFLASQDLLKQDNFERASRVYSQINQLSRLLKAQDTELFEGLRAKGLELDEFGMRWFRSYFAESLSSSALERFLSSCSFNEVSTPTPPHAVSEAIPCSNILLCCRILDMVIGGSPSIVVFLALSILLKFKHKLLHMKNANEVKQYLLLVSPPCLFSS